MWFGQKEDGITGFFESEKAVEIVDDDQGMECRKFKENRIIFVSVINCCNGTLPLVSFSLKLLNDVRLYYPKLLIELLGLDLPFSFGSY